MSNVIGGDTAYPTADGGFHHTTSEIKVQYKKVKPKPHPEAIAAYSQQLGIDAPASVKAQLGQGGAKSQEWAPPADYADIHRRNAKAIAEGKFQGYDPGPPPAPKPVSAPKVGSVDLLHFDPKVDKALDEFGQAVRAHPYDPTVVEACKKIDHAFDTLVKTSRQGVRELIAEVGKIDNERLAKSVRDANHEIESTASALSTKGNYRIAYTYFFQGYGNLVSVRDELAAMNEADIAFNDKMVKILQGTITGCKFALAVLSGGLEAGIAKQAIAKVVFAAAPAIIDGAEKLSSNWQGFDTTSTWADIAVAGLLGMGFAALGNAFELRFTPKIDLNAIFNIKDPNTQKWLLKNSSSILLTVIKTILERKKHEQIGEAYGKKPEQVEESLFQAVWSDFHKDNGGAVLKELVTKCLESMEK